MVISCDSPLTKEQRTRWVRRFLALAVVIAVLILGAAWLGRQFPPRSPARIAIALAQGALFAALIVQTLRPLRHFDELQRRIHLEALALAFAGTGILGTTYGFLITAGLPEIEWSAWIWPVMVGLWSVGLAIAGRRYR